MPVDEEDLIFDDRTSPFQIWSTSSLKTISSCGKQFYFRYRTDVEQEQTPYLAFGSVVHEIIKEIHQKQDYSDWWERRWSDRWHEVSSGVNWEGYRKPEFNNRGPKLIGQYVDKNKDVKLLEVETAFPMGEEVYKIGPYAVRGIIDQVRRTDGGRLLVVDLKTAKYPPEKLILDADPQFTIYYKVAKEKYGEDPLLALYHLESGKMLYTTRTDRDVDMVEAMIQEGQKKVDLAMFERNIGNTCKYCPFIKVCLGNVRDSDGSASALQGDRE